MRNDAKRTVCVSRMMLDEKNFTEVRDWIIELKRKQPYHVAMTDCDDLKVTEL